MAQADDAAATRLSKLAYGDDFFELSTRQLMQKFAEIRKKMYDLDEERIECFFLGLRSNSIVRCPLCKVLIKHLGHHLDNSYPMFFSKCPYCPESFVRPNYVGHALNMDIHIRDYHPVRNFTFIWNPI